jgi:hypothetical protein
VNIEASAGSLHPQVDANYKETREIIKAGQYMPAPNDQELDPMDIISEVWRGPPPHGHLHNFVGLQVGGPTLLDVSGECLI